ncbi:formimidoylglutamate deiminase [Sphaerisporangium krabiense]|uniref:Formiminoglutamate deiminase n=1 Tax=Sphaerisporangium krabiense TaxID=763782 RepID=A0A7W8YYT5_9ACTN|nr:formimidoylglutamate deiminase [Sphaerisporangium krabiense]MBB5624333.1 formiminoglutamate deiminase [Sphaerisporangium krabiense]GII61716.1 formimidoylglutamate deiminase [Sphaerisporangium krabiense]
MSDVTYWCELAWLHPGEAVEGVAVRVEGGRFADVTPGVAVPPKGAIRLAGLTLPGLANAHSHVFHRALRGRAQSGAVSFAGWRARMYAVAARLDPDSYLALARATFAEMALAGITGVGEFHYLHHGEGGRPYADPNAMGHALIEGARDAGIRITLLDACYLTGGIGAPLDGAQLRFGDGDAHRWAGRVDDLAGEYSGADDVVIGAAVHSVRACPPEQMPVVADFGRRRAAPLHTQVSERRTENEHCVSTYCATPVQVLYEHGVLGPRTTAVHATHLSDVDVALLGGSATHVCLCPTTERDLADGVGPGRRLRDAGSPVTVGTDSNAVIDLLEEARAVELDERLVTGRRGAWTADELLEAATMTGQASLGRPDAGFIVPGARADLVSVRLDSVRTAGDGVASAVDRVVFGATASDVHSVVSGGRRVVVEGGHVLGDVGTLLADAIAAVRA